MQNSAVFMLPDKLCARRVSDVLCNQLANQYPNKAHAILSQHPDNGFVVSVRAPLNNLDYASNCQQAEAETAPKVLMTYQRMN